jgi:hypothetical protein
MKTKLTSVEINLIQYVCECIAYNEKIDINEDGIKISKRISQIASNLLMSEDNQVAVDELSVKDIGSQTYFIERM